MHRKPKTRLQLALRALATMVAAVTLSGVGLASAALASPSTPAIHHPSLVRGPVLIVRAATSVLPSAADHTAVTKISFRPDGGNHDSNGWAYDFMTRTAGLHRIGLVSGVFCGLPAAHVCYKYSFKITDSGGTFQTVIGAGSPGSDGRALQAVEQGSFSGSMTGSFYVTYHNAFTADVPTSENDNGNLPAGMHTTSLWWEQFFGGAGFPHLASNTPWGWSYVVAVGADAKCPAGHWAWRDTSANGFGDLPADGDIFAPNAASCSTTPITA